MVFENLAENMVLGQNAKKKKKVWRTQQETCWEKKTIFLVYFFGFSKELGKLAPPQNH